MLLGLFSAVSFATPIHLLVRLSYVRRFYASQVLLGLQYLHSQGIIYRLVGPSQRSLYLCYFCNCVAGDIVEEL